MRSHDPIPPVPEPPRQAGRPIGGRSPLTRRLCRTGTSRRGRGSGGGRRGPAAAGVDQEEDVEDEVAAVVDEDDDDVDDDSLAPPVDEDEDDEVAAPFEELAPDRESVR